MTDRAVQDEVIRYLADANVRAHAARVAPVSAGEAAKAAQFARFLARRYYRDRLARSSRYSHRLRTQTGRVAEEVVEGTEFDGFLAECVMGSLESARRVGEMARAHLRAAPAPGPWWAELLEYESSYFLQAATSERAASTSLPARGVSAVCRRFAWALPEVLSRLRAGKSISDHLRREATLLFSRTHAGRIFVVEVEAAVELIFHATDGACTLDEIAAAAKVSVEQARRTLELLARIGAVVMPPGRS